MFKPVAKVQIIDDACIGCTRCVSVCPTGALKMESKLAVLEESRCVGCMKCAEQCIPYGAIEILPNPDGASRGIPQEDWDRPAVEALCAEARLDPDQTACLCTGTLVGEIAQAVLNGLTEPEDVANETGVRNLCGWLCLTPVTRLLEANDVHLERPPKDYRIYYKGAEPAIWNVPAEAAEKYPEYAIKETLEAIEAGELNEPVPWFVEIMPARKTS